MERAGGSSRHVRTEDLLPPPPVGRALGLAGAAAIVGAAAWGLLRIYAQVEHGAVAWGIGGLIGFAIVRAGGHGTLLAVSGAVLAVLAIGTGRQISYRAEMSEFVTEQTAQIDAAGLAEMKGDAADWAQVPAGASDEDVADFALRHDYDVEGAAEFRANWAPQLEWIQENQPSLEDYRAHMHTVIEEDIAANFTFVDYLREDFHVLDIVFVLLGLATAFGLVSKHTMALQQQARAELRAAREEEAAANAPPPVPTDRDDEARDAD